MMFWNYFYNLHCTCILYTHVQRNAPLFRCGLLCPIKISAQVCYENVHLLFRTNTLFWHKLFKFEWALTHDVSLQITLVVFGCVRKHPETFGLNVNPLTYMYDVCDETLNTKPNLCRESHPLCRLKHPTVI